MPDLNLAREIVKTGDEELLDALYASVPGTLSELIRTAFIPRDGCRFLVADFSAIEARVLAWLASEEWVLEEFRGKGKIYEATASRMFHIPQESIVKGSPNYDGFTMIPFGQGFRDMSPPTKELMRIVLEHRLNPGGHPVLRWNFDNAYVRTDPAGNLKLDKEKSTEKIDGAVALVMALDRAMKNQNGGDSVYDDRGLLLL